MRAEVWLFAGLVLTSCAVNIGNESDSSVAVQPAPALSGCLPLADRVSTLSGRVSQVTLPDDGSLVIADSATVTGAGMESSVGFSSADSACLMLSTALPARPILDVSAISSAGLGRPLAAVTVSSDAFLYFSDDHNDGLASDGIGVARWDAASGSFLALGLLWTADRPSYGSAAALVDDEVYVLGGLAARFLAADVYLARVPAAQLAEPSAYEYWQGGGNFGSDPDSALPLVAGGTAPSLAFDVHHQRWLMAYAEPLANEVKVRTGLGVTGPWSKPYVLGLCDLPTSDPSSFCTDITLVPELVTDGGIALTQVVATFARPALSTDQDYWTRLVRAPWPSALP
jgi:hypothetical protein